jgi:hypothetical protein
MQVSQIRLQERAIQVRLLLIYIRVKIMILGVTELGGQTPP